MISDFSLFFLKHFNLILSKAFSLCVIPCSNKQQHEVTSIWENNCLLGTQTQRVEMHCPLCTQKRGNRLLDMHECVTNITIFQFSSAYRKTKSKTTRRAHTHIHEEN